MGEMSEVPALFLAIELNANALRQIDTVNPLSKAAGPGERSKEIGDRASCSCSSSFSSSSSIPVGTSRSHKIEDDNEDEENEDVYGRCDRLNAKAHRTRKRNRVE